MFASRLLSDGTVLPRIPRLPMPYPRMYLSHCTVAACGEIETRCVNIIARLFPGHAPFGNPEAQALRVSTIGSSETIILLMRFGLLCMERTNDLHFPGSRCEMLLAKFA
jgi:hypothetical protein